MDYDRKVHVIAALHVSKKVSEKFIRIISKEGFKKGILKKAKYTPAENENCLVLNCLK